MAMKGETKLVRIRKSTHKKLRLLAADNEITLADMVEKLVTSAQDRNKAESKTS